MSEKEETSLSRAITQCQPSADRVTLNSSIISASANEDGGNISLNASDLDVNDSRIEAESLSSKGGNITVESDSTLFQNSDLSASAADKGDGGNITIDADTVLGLNSDITATAFLGDGGNILIDADAVIGFAEREADSDNLTSDVDASSEFGRDGVVVITNPQNTTNDPTIALNEVPQSTLPLSLVEDCYNSQGEPILTNSIHGDFPEGPDDYLDYSSVISDNEAVDEKFLEPEQSSEVRPEPETTTYHPVDMAIETEDGRVYLVNQKQLMELEQRGCIQFEEALGD